MIKKKTAEDLLLGVDAALTEFIYNAPRGEALAILVNLNLDDQVRELVRIALDALNEKKSTVIQEFPRGRGRRRVTYVRKE